MVKCKVNVEYCPKKKDICCHECSELETCDGVCNLLKEDGEFTPFQPLEECEDAVEEPDEDNGLVLFENNAAAVITSITDLVRQKKVIEEQEELVRFHLEKAMDEYGVKSFENDVIKIARVDATTRTSIDSAKLKKKYPEIAVECEKKSAVKASVKITLKG